MDVFSLAAKITMNTSEYENSLTKMSETTAKSGKELQKSFDNSLVKVSETATRSGEKLQKYLEKAAKAAKVAIGTITTAATAFAVSSVKVGMEFDSSMSQVAATMGKTMEELDSEIGSVELSTGTFTGTLREFAEKMGSETAFSATQAAEALNYMALAGYDVNEAMTALPNVLNLASAGGIDLAYASDMVTDAQSALGLSMEESSELVDKMAMASSKSNTSVAQLGEAILTVGGTAKNLAGGTTELSTALGILADNGVKGAEGGTALRNIILSLSAPTDTAAQAMENMGVEVFDAEGKMRPLNETFNDLNMALSTMTQAERTQVLDKLFNKVDLKSAEALLSNAGDRFEELTGYIDAASGAAENMASTQLDNFSGDITILKSGVEGLQIAFSDKLTPALRKGTQFLTKLVGKAKEFIEKGGIEKIVETFKKLSPTIAAATAAMVAYKAATSISKVVDALKAATEGQTIAQAALNAVMNANPFVLVATLIAAVGAALVTLYTTNETFRNKVNAAWQSIKDTISNIVAAIVTFFTQTVPNAGRKMLEFFQTFPAKALQWGKELVDKIISGLKSKFYDVTNSARELVDKILSGIREKFSALLDMGREVVSNVKNGITQKIDEAKNWGKDLIDNFTSGIRSKIESVKSAVSSVASAVKGFLGFSEPEEGPLSNFHTYAPDMMKLFAQGITDNAGLLKTAFDKSLDFGVPPVSVSGEASYMGTMAHGTRTSAQFGDINININGAQYRDERQLAQVISEELQHLLDRRNAFAPA